MDIGPRSQKLFASRICGVGSLFWNGPFGLVENPDFAGGSEFLAHEIVRTKAVKIAGGGDLSVLLERSGVIDRFDHISTGGGAMLEFLAKKRLPGLEAIGYYEER